MNFETKQSIQLLSLLAFLSFSLPLSVAQAQTKSSPRQIRASVITQRNTQYPQAPLSLDGYLVNSKNKCMNRVARQIKSLTEKNDPTFNALNEAAGKKLAKMDERCKFFRIELINYTDADIYGTSTSDMRFTYRCYETSNVKLPSQRVAQAPVVKINPVVLYKNVRKDKDYSDELIKQKCDFITIAKNLNKNLDTYLKNGGYEEKEETQKSSGSYQIKKSSKPTKSAR